MKSMSLALLVLVPFALFAACDSGDDEVKIPTQQELVGTWVNDDEGTTRAFEFSSVGTAAHGAALDGQPFAYTLYFFPTGGAPAVAQHGRYTIEEGHLVTEVVDAPIDPSLAGQRFANVVLGFDAAKLTLESTSSATGKRVFVKSESL